MTTAVPAVLNDGFGGYLLLALIALFAHEPWRWIGLALGRNLSDESPVFLWVRYVATALVAGLVMRLILFPAGALQSVGLPLRLAAMAVGIGAFFALGRKLGLGIAIGALALLVGQVAGMGG